MRKLVAVALVVVCLPAVASAGEKKKEDVEHIEFKDADTLTTQHGLSEDMRVGARKMGVRTILVRPRLQFVIELLKTIENL
ncbi:MAG: hypothetical protein IPJ34_19215 [Myxococcales bacterium]|nr:hypothetical protein [Myxococcales bacterium]MBL8716801.1 hypothetical protein [Myxococcales bacterium]